MKSLSWVLCISWFDFFGKDLGWPFGVALRFSLPHPVRFFEGSAGRGMVGKGMRQEPKLTKIQQKSGECWSGEFLRKWFLAFIPLPFIPLPFPVPI